MSRGTQSDHTSVVKRAGIVGAGTMLSRLLGLVRESTIAALFSKEIIDAYQVAFMLPNSFRRLTAEGAFSMFLTSVFTKLFRQGDSHRTRRFVAAVYGFSLLFLTLLTLAGMFGAKWLTMLAGSGFIDDPHKFALTVSLTRYMFPYIFFVSLTASAMGLLNSVGRFFAPAFAPVLLNLSIIGCAVGLSGMMPSWGWHPVYALATGVLVGGIAQVLLQVPFLKAANLLVLPRLDFSNPSLRRVLLLTAPMVFAAAAYQVFNMITMAYASTLEDGAVMYISFSQRAFELPLAVMVMAISTAALPSLAGLAGEGRIEDAKRVWMGLVRLSLFLAVPAMVAFIVLAEPLIAIMYQRGKFTYSETVETARALQWIAAGMVPVALLRQTTPFFYALERVKLPFLMSLLMMVIYIVVGWFLKDILGHVGLCMTLSLATLVQSVALFGCLRRLVGPLGTREMIGTGIKTLLASVLMGVIVYGISRLGTWEQGGNSVINIGTIVLCVVSGCGVYLLFAKIMNIVELRVLLDAIRKKR